MDATVLLAMVNGVLRALLASLGGYLIAKGYVTADGWATVSGHVVGAVLVAIPMLWTVYAKWRDRNKS